MTPPRNEKKLTLPSLGRRSVEVDFSAGQVSSDGGGLLLREVDRRLNLTGRLAACFVDFRNPELIEHSVKQMVAQRTYGLALGYEDLNDHEAIGRDPLLAALVGKTDPKGEQRRHKKDRGHPLASASTLGRIERSREDASPQARYDKVVCDFDKVADVFVELFIESVREEPQVLVLDLDPSDIELHGQQEQRFYHGYYREHCYLPMYLFCGEYPLAVKLRPSNIDGALGADDLLMRVIPKLRQRWPKVQLIVRGDSGFCREWLMRWCEINEVDYVFGIARNARLESAVKKQMEQARRAYWQTRKPARRFRSFWYRTLKGWTRRRRVVGKAEYLQKGANPRFVVTSLPASEYEKRYLYEEVYCARGEMENRIKEEQLDLFGDRASAHRFRGNELRAYLSAAAHWLMVGLRQHALIGTKLAHAQASTLRVRLLKIGALIEVSVRRVYVRLSSAFTMQDIFKIALRRLRAPPCCA